MRHDLSFQLIPKLFNRRHILNFMWFHLHNLFGTKRERKKIITFTMRRTDVYCIVIEWKWIKKFVKRSEAKLSRSFYSLVSFSTRRCALYFSRVFKGKKIRQTFLLSSLLLTSQFFFYKNNFYVTEMKRKISLQTFDFFF